jgi:hypothetical protein
VRDRVPKIPAEADLVLLADLLIAEEEHAVIEEGRSQAVDLLDGERASQVDAPDLGSHCASRGDDLHVAHVL